MSMMVFSNQPIGLKKGKTKKTYTFSKKEFNPDKVPPYAYNLQIGEESVSFQCDFEGNGTPIFKKKTTTKKD